MKVVIDVGCARYGGDYSIERLIEHFEPDALYGFDPAWEPSMFDANAYPQTNVRVSTDVAWTRRGLIHFMQDGLNGQVGDFDFWPLVRCIDLARFIKGFQTAEEIILKMDAEGSEYALLDHLIDKGVDERLSLAWIEWHPRGVPDPEASRASIESRIRCPLDEWPW